VTDPTPVNPANYPSRVWPLVVSLDDGVTAGHFYDLCCRAGFAVQLLPGNSFALDVDALKFIRAAVEQEAIRRDANLRFLNDPETTAWCARQRAARRRERESASEVRP